MDTELNSKIIKEKYRFFVPKKLMYSFRIDKEIIAKAKKEVKNYLYPLLLLSDRLF